MHKLNKSSNENKINTVFPDKTQSLDMTYAWEAVSQLRTAGR